MLVIEYIDISQLNEIVNMQNKFILSLGTAQDGGYPHIGCRRKCCQPAWNDSSKRRFVSSLAIINTLLNECWIIDASPDIKYQLNMISDFLKMMLGLALSILLVFFVTYM